MVVVFAGPVSGDTVIKFYTGKDTTFGVGAWEKDFLRRINIEDDSSVQKLIEAEADADLEASLNQMMWPVKSDLNHDIPSPRQRPEPKLKNGKPYYPRNPVYARNAIISANYKCEFDPNHKTFSWRSTGEQYMEAHHLVPMGNQKEVEMDLDRESNIVSLCCNCHKQIHNGKDPAEIIKKLYNQRKELLKEDNIDPGLEKLLKM